MKKTLKYILICFFIIVLAVNVAGCSFSEPDLTFKEKEHLFNKYGKDAAYMGGDDGIYLNYHLSNNIQVDFYIDTDMAGELQTAARSAISKANEISGNFTITANGEKDSAYKFTIAELTGDNANAGAIASSKIQSGYIIETTIYYNSLTIEPYMQYAYSLEDISLHELGHFFGLADINYAAESETDRKNLEIFSLMHKQRQHIKDHSPLCFVLPSVKFWCVCKFDVNFTEFDTANILWRYDADKFYAMYPYGFVPK